MIEKAEVEMNAKARQLLINQAVELVQKEVLVIPLHRQVIPWVSSSNVTLIHSSENKLVPIWVKMK